MNFIHTIYKFVKEPRTFGIFLKGMGYYGLACLLCAITLASCSSRDDLDGPQDPDAPSTDGTIGQKNYYIALNVKLPSTSGTRSSTENDGSSSDFEFEGSTKENLLNSAEIYFLDANYRVITSFATTSDTNDGRELTISPDNTYDYKIYVEVDINELTQLTGHTIYMVVVGNAGAPNYTSGFRHTLNSDYPNSAKLTNVSLGANGTLKDYGDDNQGQIMPLVSAKTLKLDALGNINRDGSLSGDDLIRAITAVFTGSLVKDGQNHYSYPVGTVNLERCVARIDYRDRTAEERESGIEEWTYRIGKNDNVSDFYIRLNQLQAFNINSGSYLFRHAIAGTTDGAINNNEGIILFGDENGTGSGYNWIMGHDWTLSSGNWGKNPSLLNPKADLATSTDASILISTLKERTPKGTSSAPEDLYFPWRYVTENTLPTKSMMESYEDLDQNATGVAFTFILQDNTGKNDLEYSDTKENYPLGCTNVNVNSTDKSDHSICLTMPNGQWINVSPNDDGKYELTYYGYLVHNNPNATTLDPMEYGVVRNNAYQIMVNSVGNLPNPEDPKTMYLEITSNIKPWQQRGNDYGF